MSNADELRRLSEQVAQISRNMDTVMSGMLDLRLRMTNIEGNTAGPGPTRSSGYVNWNASHDVLKTQRWIKLSTISECIKQMERFRIFNTGQERLKRLSTSSVLVAVSEVKRFPKSGAFVNIYCPHVSAELHSLTTQPKPEFMPGLLQRFNDNCRDDIHTFSSFEEKYQLKWVD